MAGLALTEGHVAVEGGAVWWRALGDGPVPLVLVHGGPGAPSVYLAELEALARPGERRVVRYDQLGAGASDWPLDPGLWRIERSVAELDAVRAAAGAERIDLLGHSWGAMVALEYALAHPARVRALILADGCADMPQLDREMRRLAAELPPDVRAVLEAGDEPGWSGPPRHRRSAAYRAAEAVFGERHVCLVPVPPAHAAAFATMPTNPAYLHLWGPGLFPTGSHAAWSCTARLGEIAAPTLVLVGRHDALTPACARTIADGIPGARLHVFERSSHLPHVEEPDAFLAAVDGFLDAR